MTNAPSGSDIASVTPPSPHAEPPRETTEFTLYDLINITLRHRRLIFMLPLTLTVAVVAFGLTRGRMYSASASFMPQTSENALSKLGGLAGQFGVNIGGGAPGQTPAFYANLLQSREILGPVVDSAYAVRGPDGAQRRTLVELFKITSGTPGARHDEAVLTLKKYIGVTIDFETGIVRLKVLSNSPELAQQIAQHMLNEVDAFNLRRRRAQAAAERIFIEERVRQLRDDLRAAEQERASFLEQNRDYRNSPQLFVKAEQLDREVSMRQAIFTNFSQAYEQAKIDEVRNTPLITVVERPEYPTSPERRRLAMKGLVSLVSGGLFAVLLALVIEFFQRAKVQDPEGAARFAELRREVSSGLRRPFFRR